LVRPAQTHAAADFVWSAAVRYVVLRRVVRGDD